MIEKFNFKKHQIFSFNFVRPQEEITYVFLETYFMKFYRKFFWKFCNAKMAIFLILKSIFLLAEKKHIVLEFGITSELHEIVLSLNLKYDC